MTTDKQTQEWAELLKGLGPAGDHLVKAATELLMALRHAVGSLSESRDRVRNQLRVEALEDIAGAIEDEMIAAQRSEDAEDPNAVARLAALAEVLAAVRREATKDDASAAAGGDDYEDVWSGWSTPPSGDFERVPIEDEEETAA